ncbi:MAG TPA: hypothetical protein VH352_24515 [Pseudonocardiaceae bacterium]|nr:hypothetical protein [Pseudonocardiaceae bacterium]
MIHPLATSLLVAALAGAVWAAVLLTLSRPVGKRFLLGALALIEVGLLVQAVFGIVALATEHRHVDGFTFVGYLVASLLILPLAGWWSLAERSRWGVGVLLIGCLVIPVMIVRMNQIWSGFGA